MTRIESTGTLALVASNFCAICGQALPEAAEWCDECERHKLGDSWTSGNADYDKIIKDSYTKDESAYYYPSLQWIPSARLENLVEISTGNFGKLYTAELVRVKTEFDDELKVVSRRKAMKVSVKVPAVTNQDDINETMLQEVCIYNCHFFFLVTLYFTDMIPESQLNAGAEIFRTLQQVFDCNRVDASNAELKIF